MAKDIATIHIAEAGSLGEVQFDTENRIIRDAIIATAGESHNRVEWTPEVMRRDGSKTFEGIRGYLGHVKTDFERSDPRNLSHTMKNVRYQESDSTLRGDVHYFSGADAEILKAKEAFDRGEKDLLGLSVQTDGTRRIRRRNGHLVSVLESLTRNCETSVDIVVGPSAGGRLFEAQSAQEVSELETLDKLSLDELTEARPDLVLAIKEAHTKAEKPADDPKPPAAKADDKPAEDVRISEAVKKMDELSEKLAVQECSLRLQEALTTANLPEDLATRVRSKFGGKLFEAAELEDEVGFMKDQAAKRSTVFRAIEGQRIQVLAEPEDKMQIAMDVAFGVDVEDRQGVKPFKGLREAYTVMTHDAEVTGHFRVSEALTSAAFPYILGTSMYRRLIQDYKARNWGWEKFCTTGSAENFKTQESIRVGYFGDLDTDINPETADYNEIAPFGEEEATYTIKQMGNILTVTRKMIINDDLNSLAKVVGRLGRAAARTLAQRVFVTMLEDNAVYTVEGSNVFFRYSGRTPAANYNTAASASAAISAANILSMLAKMELMVEPSSGKVIGLDGNPGDLVLIVPQQLKQTAVGLNQINPQANLGTTYNALFQFFGQNNEDIVSCPLLQNTTDYYLAWKPSQMEWMAVNFLQGRQEPEFFLADNPVVGDMFVADRMKYKIRHEYEAVFLDCRGCWKMDSSA